MSYKYCPRCGGKMRPHQDERTRRMKCFNCDFIHYLNPSPAAGVLVFDDHGQILLVQRAFEPYKGTWVIPSGYVEYDEGIKITAVRELKEETGLDVEIAGIHAVESCFDDPRGNTIIVIFNGIITGGELIAGDDAMDARFFHLADLPEIGFECQRRIISGLKENIS